jgi:hypothetical protein
MNRGKLNILDLNIHSENFYAHFLNLVFKLELKNLNTIKHNAEAVDLVDQKNEIFLQVSATATKQKIDSTLSKDLRKYKDYRFKFLAISVIDSHLKNKSFKNPHDLKFEPNEDILDISKILKHINSKDIEEIKRICDFLKKELSSEFNSSKVESNLAKIITIISDEDWSENIQSYETIPYDIDTKITYNDLKSTRVLIEDFKVHYHRLDKIYIEFDKQGKNKSLSTLNSIRSEYSKLDSTTSPDDCFLAVIDKVIQKIQASANYSPIPYEELELCVQILVVDAFIRCKIFKNPLGKNDANP